MLSCWTKETETHVSESSFYRKMEVQSMYRAPESIWGLLNYINYCNIFDNILYKAEQMEILYLDTV